MKQSKITFVVQSSCVRLTAVTSLNVVQGFRIMASSSTRPRRGATLAQRGMKVARACTSKPTAEHSLSGVDC